MLARDEQAPLRGRGGDRRRGDRVATFRARFPARSGRRSDDPRNPRDRLARAVGHQHAALAGLCRDRAKPRNASRERSSNSGIRAEKAKWDEYKYYPDQFFEPYYGRRRAVGYALYGHLGIGKRDVDQMRAQHDRNFVFFDAPVGMIFTIDRRLNQGSWIDYGMFLQNIMIAARARGLHTCPQAAFAPYSPTRSGRCSALPTRRSWSAAWRSATRTCPSRKTTCAPNARRWKSG